MPTREFKPTHTYRGHVCMVVGDAGCGDYQIEYPGGSREFVHGSELKPISTSLGITTKDLEEYRRNFKPNHYHSGGIDPWQFIEANMNPQQAIGFHLGNVLKYVARHEKKNGLEDLKKALDSLQEGIRLYEKAKKDPRVGLQEGAGERDQP
jgi:hypothetical protein